MSTILKDVRSLHEALNAGHTVSAVKADFDRMIEAEISNVRPAAEAQRRAEQFDLELLARMGGNGEDE